MSCFQCFQSWIFCSSPSPKFSRQILANCPLFIYVPAASYCCLSSEDTHITMQAAYGQALCLRKGKSFFLSFLLYSCCALLPKYVINFILYLLDNGENEKIQYFWIKLQHMFGKCIQFVIRSKFHFVSVYLIMAWMREYKETLKSNSIICLVYAFSVWCDHMTGNTIIF